MPYQKMNLSGQAIYAPKKVYLSKSLSDQAPGDTEKTDEPDDSQAVNANMLEIQSREILSLFGQPNAIPKPFCPSILGSGQFIVNNSTGCGHHFYVENETDHHTVSYLSPPRSSPHSCGFFSSVIGSTGPNLLSPANSSFEGQNTFAPSFMDAGKPPSGYYSKEPGGPVSSVNTSQVPVSTRQVASVNVKSEVSSVDIKPPVPSVNDSQVSFANTASCFGQNLSADPYNTCQFLSTPKISNVTGSGQALSINDVVASIGSEATGSSRRLETLKESKYVDQLLVSSSSNVSQSTFDTTSSIARCDSTQSPLMLNQGLTNSPESWTFSPLVPFSLSGDGSFDESGSPFPVTPEETSAQSTLDQLQSDIKIPASISKDTLVSEHFSSPDKNSSDSTMTWAQRYGINLKLKRPSLNRPSLNRVSLADIEEFSGKSAARKRKSADKHSNNKLLSPPEPKKQSNSSVEVTCSPENQMICSNSSSVVLSSPQVSSTDMNQGFSPKGSYQGQNKIPTDLSPMPSSTSEGLAVPPNMYGIGEEDSNEISSSESVIDRVRPPGSDAYCQVCGDKAAGFYCGAFICEACKKFFMRAIKLEKLKYVCLRVGKCVITKESRVQCQYCRFQKCVGLKMYCPGTGDSRKKGKKIGEIPCRVCSAPSSGFHFGALTCEGCKGFFRRMAKERECQRYKCSKSGSCEVNTVTRNLCKACRYRRCLDAGMSIEGSRIGRQPNSIKHAISIEAENQGKQHAVNEGININDVEAMVSSAIPATAEELAQITVDIITPQGFDLMKKTKVTAHEKHDLEITPLPIVPVEIKQEPQSPIGEAISPLTLTSSNSSSSIYMDCINCEKSWEILNKCSDCNEELETLLPANENNKDNELDGYSTLGKTWISMMASFDHTARKLIKFSKKVPGFRAMSLDDQIKLIQASIYPIVVLNCSRSFDNETKQYSYFNFTTKQRETIHSFFPMLKILTSHFTHTGIMVKLMNLSTMEYTFLSILLLLNPDVENLEDSQSVRRLQMDTTFALQYHEETTYTDGSTRFGMLLVRLAELHFILMQHHTAINIMLKKNPNLTLPGMYKEMFGEKVLES